MYKGKNKFEKINPRILKNCLEGKGRREEIRKMEECFSGLDPWTSKDLENIKELWDEIPGDIPAEFYDPEKIQNRIHHIIRLEEASEYEREKVKNNLARYITRTAAVLFIPLVIFTLFNHEKEVEKIPDISKTEIHSPPGARNSFVLPDGSSGWLNGASTIKFPSGFEGASRRVELRGEAYFSVLKNHEKSLVVVTGELKVRVYGTSFNVKAYKDDPTTEISLETGQIEVFKEDRTGKEKSLGIMAPGARGVLQNGTETFETETVDISLFTSWKDGKLVFHNEPMTQVVKKLNRWYNVNIVILDPRLEKYTYRATFVDENLDEALKIFELTSPIAFKEMKREKNPDGSYGIRNIIMYYSEP